VSIFGDNRPDGLADIDLELQQIGLRPVAEIALDAGVAMQVLAALQFALQHPDNGDLIDSRVQEIARQIERGFAPYPRLAAIAAAGWNRNLPPSASLPVETGAPWPEAVPATVKNDTEQAYLHGLSLHERAALETEAQARMPPALREKLEAVYADAQTPGVVTRAALDKARRQVVGERLHSATPAPND
jgi:hypothetical protein